MKDEKFRSKISYMVVICIFILQFQAFGINGKGDIPTNDSVISNSNENFIQESVGFNYFTSGSESTITKNQNTYSIETSVTFGFNPSAPDTVGYIKCYIPSIQTRSSQGISGIIPIQTAELLNIRASGGYGEIEYYFDSEDDYGNAYDYYEVYLTSSHPTFEFHSEYKVTLYETSWDITDSSMEGYILTDPTYQNLTGAEFNLEVDDPSLVSASNQICIGKSSPVEKAQAIYDWIASNIEYLIDEDPDDKGALWTYYSKIGDCSEFSNLMVTLLRIQGIPARKVIGIALVDDQNGLMSNKAIGSSVEYKINLENGIITQDMPLHAWVEYLIPDYGFVICDPTWSDAGDYFNNIDSIHLATTIGENYGGGIYPPLSCSITEFPTFYPMYGGFSLDEIVLDHTIKITVVNDDYGNFNALIFVPIAVVLIGIIGTILFLSKKKKNEPYFDEYGYATGNFNDY